MRAKFCVLRGATVRQGFSSVELLCVLAIAAILVTAAAPAFRDMLRKQRLTSSVNDLFAAVNLTRAEAIARGRRVDLVPTDGTSWLNGWTVFVDLNDNQRPDAGEHVIFTQGSLPAELEISSTFVAATPPYLAYNGTGRTRSNASSQASRSGSWELTLGPERRKIIVSFIGRPRVCNPAVDTSC